MPRPTLAFAETKPIKTATGRFPGKEMKFRIDEKLYAEILEDLKVREQNAKENQDAKEQIVGAVKENTDEV